MTFWRFVPTHLGLDTSELTRLRFLGTLMNLDRLTIVVALMNANPSFQGQWSTRGDGCDVILNLGTTVFSRW